MRDSELKAMGWIAIDAGLLDQGLITAALRVKLAERDANFRALETAETLFNRRVQWLHRTGIIQIVPTPAEPPQSKKRRSA